METLIAPSLRLWTAGRVTPTFQILKEGDLQILQRVYEMHFDSLVYEVAEDERGLLLRLHYLVEAKTGSLEDFDEAVAVKRIRALAQNGMQVPDRQGIIKYFSADRIFLRDGKTISRFLTENESRPHVPRENLVLMVPDDHRVPNDFYLFTRVFRGRFVHRSIVDLAQQLLELDYANARWVQKVTDFLRERQRYHPRRNRQRSQIRFGEYILPMTRHRLFECMNGLAALGLRGA